MALSSLAWWLTASWSRRSAQVQSPLASLVRCLIAAELIYPSNSSYARCSCLFSFHLCESAETASTLSAIGRRRLIISSSSSEPKRSWLQEGEELLAAQHIETSYIEATRCRNASNEQCPAPSALLRRLPLTPKQRANAPLHLFHPSAGLEQFAPSRRWRRRVLRRSSKPSRLAYPPPAYPALFVSSREGSAVGDSLIASYSSR